MSFFGFGSSKTKRTYDAIDSDTDTNNTTFQMHNALKTRQNAITGKTADVLRVVDRYNLDINTDFLDESLNTLLHTAVRTNNTRLAKGLCERGADINAENCFGETPWTLCEVYNQQMRNVLSDYFPKVIKLRSVNAALKRDLQSSIADLNTLKRRRISCARCTELQSELKKVKTERNALQKDNNTLQNTVKSMRKRLKK